MGTPSLFWRGIVFDTSSRSSLVEDEHEVSALAEEDVEPELSRELFVDLEALAGEDDVLLEPPLLPDPGAAPAGVPGADVALLEDDDVLRRPRRARLYAVASPFTPPPMMTMPRLSVTASPPRSSAMSSIRMRENRRTYGRKVDEPRIARKARCGVGRPRVSAVRATRGFSASGRDSTCPGTCPFRSPCTV